MTETKQKQLGNTLWVIAYQLRGAKDARAQPACCSRNRCASSAAMQPVPALVMAWR